MHCSDATRDVARAASSKQPIEHLAVSHSVAKLSVVVSSCQSASRSSAAEMHLMASGWESHRVSIVYLRRSDQTLRRTGTRRGRPQITSKVHHITMKASNCSV